ncbi:FISUMP domain-containing protein [Fibrobacter sp.]|uniref:FISUMP domain-containing protein n=1 Tax=Fibrobacter sp. TaxID=35828 RepID=UPI0025B99228|nr:FISUMP domain-containing protein [Fibrobacter sp.]
MKRLIASSAILFLCSALLFGCGDENTTEITQVVGMQVLEKGEAMPKCSADNEGAMVYSVDSAEAFYCIDKNWKSMKGEKGEDGEKGADGEAGPAGADGKDGSSCTAKSLKNGKGYKILCGGDSVGVVRNGKNGVDGDSGIAGENGLSAYEIAKAAGYKGTETEWIGSLKGDSGAAGTSCSAEEVTGGIKISCTDGKSYTLRDGTDGSDGKSFVDGWMVDPRDKQLYRVVNIGSQIWMAENLNYETETGSNCYKDVAENCKKYGRHYTWAAAVGKSEEECGFEVECDLGKGNVRGVCPEGWHLPDTTEWNVLFATVGGIDSAGTMLKSTEGWAIDGNGMDNYGFSALPAGYTNGSGISTTMNESAIFWSSTAEDGYLAYSLAFLYKEKKVSVGKYSKYFAYSVRCIKD